VENIFVIIVKAVESWFWKCIDNIKRKKNIYITRTHFLIKKILEFVCFLSAFYRKCIFYIVFFSKNTFYKKKWNKFGTTIVIKQYNKLKIHFLKNLEKNKKFKYVSKIKFGISILGEFVFAFCDSYSHRSWKFFDCKIKWCVTAHNIMYVTDFQEC